MPQLPTVCHITTVHPRYDIRIFRKQCMSLSKFYQVVLIVADGKGHEKKNGISIHDAGLTQTSRIKRFTQSKAHIFNAAISKNAAIYHLHDPELLPLGLKLLKAGKHVIYDSHEDVPRQILSKEYIPTIFKSVISHLYEIYENRCAKKYSCIVAATPFIEKRFKKYNPCTISVNNYPIAEEFRQNTKPEKKPNVVCYVGAITKNRGICETLEALKDTPLELHLAGSFVDKNLQRTLQKNKLWKQVQYFGFVNRKDVVEIISASNAGLVTLHPTKNYIDSLPIKMFEYMAAGLAVVASDFPLWKTIINEFDCGIAVDPLNPSEIREALMYLIKHPLEAERMGRNGLKAIEKYNWRNEKEKLLSIYDNLISK